jgi:hypothetical protein
LQKYQARAGSAGAGGWRRAPRRAAPLALDAGEWQTPIDTRPLSEATNFELLDA